MQKRGILLGLLVLLTTAGESPAWVTVPDYGDSGWQTYIYQAGPAGFTGAAGFVVSNVLDDSAFSELLLDNLSCCGADTNRDFEMANYSGYQLWGDDCAEIASRAMAASGQIYYPTQGEFFSHQCCLSTGVSTAASKNANHQAGTLGSMVETLISLPPKGKFSFDWAFLGGDQSPWSDFALFYLKDVDGKIVFTAGLAQIGPLKAPAIIGILNSGLLSLGGPEGRSGVRRRFLPGGYLTQNFKAGELVTNYQW